eukprot:9471957-Pyramimonas_sp.AAC.2
MLFRALCVPRPTPAMHNISTFLQYSVSTLVFISGIPLFKLSTEPCPHPSRHWSIYLALMPPLPKMVACGLYQAAPSSCADWANLPPNVLPLVLEHLQWSRAESGTVRTVCKAWLDVHDAHLPCLMVRATQPAQETLNMPKWDTQIQHIIRFN